MNSLSISLLLTACGPGGESASSNRLIVVTPHNEHILNEFERAFAAHYAQNHDGAPIEIEWQDRGGTVEIVKYLTSAYQALDDPGKGVGIDLLFGGGVPAYEQLIAGDCLEAAGVPDESLAGIPPAVGGVRMYDADRRWFGVVLSSFGIIHYNPGLASKGLAPPESWADLADPSYLGQIVLADPGKSGSARVCYELILQKYGWEEGWALLMRIAGNAREFTDNASQVPLQVAQGGALAGMCIDFYAYTQIDEKGGDVVGFVSPANATAITPDPIAMLRGAPRPDIAREFIQFVLSEKGQTLWGLKPGAPGGPVITGLWRLPILPSVYERHGEDMLMKINPFEAAGQFQLDQELSSRREPLIGPLFQAAFLSNMDSLRQAWKAVLANPGNAEAAAAFTAVPFSLDEGLRLIGEYLQNPRRQVELDQAWREEFRRRYQRVVQLASTP